MRGENGSTLGKASQSRVEPEPTNPIHIRRQMRKLNAGHIGSRQLLSQYVCFFFLFFFMKYCSRLDFFLLLRAIMCYLFNCRAIVLLDLIFVRVCHPESS